MILTQTSDSSALRGEYGNTNLNPDSLPKKLIASVTQEQQKGRTDDLVSTPTQMSYQHGRAPVPGLAIGGVISPRYQLYYLFPMEQQQQTLALVQRAMLGGGLALVVLLVGIVSLVTRWVVVPIREAAEAAKRLSDGQLERADAGPRHRRPGRSGEVVQWDGRQPAGEAARAGGAVQGAAAVRLRRVARAAHPADHDPDRG